MLVKMTVNLPYSWCQYCTRMELQTIESRADGNKSETDHTCANATICKAAEDARLREEIECQDEATKDSIRRDCLARRCMKTKAKCCFFCARRNSCLNQCYGPLQDCTIAAEAITLEDEDGNH